MSKQTSSGRKSSPGSPRPQGVIVKIEESLESLEKQLEIAKQHVQSIEFKIKTLKDKNDEKEVIQRYSRDQIFNVMTISDTQRGVSQFLAFSNRSMTPDDKDVVCFINNHKIDFLYQVEMDCNIRFEIMTMKTLSPTQVTFSTASYKEKEGIVSLDFPAYVSEGRQSRKIFIRQNSGIGINKSYFCILLTVTSAQKELYGIFPSDPFRVISKSPSNFEVLESPLTIQTIPTMENLFTEPNTHFGGVNLYDHQDLMDEIIPRGDSYDFDDDDEGL